MLIIKNTINEMSLENLIDKNDNNNTNNINNKNEKLTIDEAF